MGITGDWMRREHMRGHIATLEYWFARGRKFGLIDTKTNPIHEIHETIFSVRIACSSVPMAFKELVCCSIYGDQKDMGK